MRLTLTPNNNASRHLELREIPWEDLASYLARHEDGPKDGEAFIPAALVPCGVPCKGRSKGRVCDGGAHRLAANVSHVSALVVDLDHLSPERLEQILASFARRNLELVWWHTHSYTLERPSARLLIPFAEELPLASPRAWSLSYWPRLMTFLGLPHDADAACRDPARLYYLPRKPAGGAHQAGRIRGALLDWRPVLGDLSAALPVDSSSSPPPDVEEDPSRPVPLEEVRARLAAVHAEPQASYLWAILQGEAPCPPPDKRQGGKSRYEVWRAVTHQVALCADGWMSSTALAELLRPSWAAEVEESPHDHTSWERVEQLLSSARLAASAYKAQKTGELNALRKAMLRRSLRDARTGARAEPETDAEKERLEILETLLERLPPKQPGEIGPIRPSAENIPPVLVLHGDWHGTLKYNSLTKKAEVWGGPLLGEHETPGRPLRDSDILETRDWLARRLQLRFPDSVVAPRLFAAAEETTYNPLKDYLLGLEWDGVDRLTDFLVVYFGASTQCAEEDISPYVRAVGKKWLLSAVARGLDPGCQVDSVLELEGAQGAGKSSALRILGGQFFSDEPISASGDKDSLLALAGVWLVELAERAAFSRAEGAKHKEFISRRVDRYRPPYGRATIEVPRSCVFAATTNETEYLSDTTGNRRHWPVSVGTIDLVGLRTNRDQIWAEAVARYQAGETHFLEAGDLVVRRLAETQAEARVFENPIAAAIEHWILSRPPERRPRTLTTREICADILDEPPCRAQEVKIGKAMQKLGYAQARRWVHGTLTRYYQVPERILQAPAQTGRARTMIQGGGSSGVGGSE